MDHEQESDIAWRNRIRSQLRAIAKDLSAGRSSPDDSASRLLALAAETPGETDDPEIEIDFDTGGTHLGPLISNLLGGARGKTESSGDPLEDALSKVIRIRDRNQGLRIVASQPGSGDVAAYRSALRALRKELNAAFGKNGKN